MLRLQVAFLVLLLRAEGMSLQGLRDDRRGVTALEYGLIAALIAVVIIVSVKKVGANVNSTFMLFTPGGWH